MLYLNIFLIMAISVTIDMFVKRSSFLRLDLFFFVGILFLATFRFGIGMDYFGYIWHYHISPSTILGGLENPTYQEFGYKVWMSFCKANGLKATEFLSLTAFLSIFWVGLVIRKHSNQKMLSIFIYYSIYYMIYYNSGVRQGIAMSIILSAIFIFVHDKKLWKFVFFVFLGSLFHRSALITLLVPMMLKCKKIILKNINLIHLFSGILLFLGLFCMEPIIKNILVLFNRGMYQGGTAWILAIAMKYINLLMILYCYKNMKSKISESEEDILILYLFGIFIYFLLCQVQILSRLVEYFMFLEIILLPNLLFKFTKRSGPYVNKNSVFFLIGFLAVVSVVFLKDMNSFLSASDYYENNLSAYKYVSIFNKEDIFLYREVIYSIDLLLQ